MLSDVIQAVARNARKHEQRHGTPPGSWDQARDLRYLRSLTEEVGELAAALGGKHEHPMELEVIQIAGLCLNWLAARGTSPAFLEELATLDAVKHPEPASPPRHDPLAPRVLDPAASAWMKDLLQQQPHPLPETAPVGREIDATEFLHRLQARAAGEETAKEAIVAAAIALRPHIEWSPRRYNRQMLPCRLLDDLTMAVDALGRVPALVALDAAQKRKEEA